MTRAACQRLKVARLSPMRVPPPRVPASEGGGVSPGRGPPADPFGHERQAIDRPADVMIPQRLRYVDQARVKNKGFGLAKRVDHTVKKSNEESGVEAHGAGGIEQDHEAQRLAFAPAPDEIDRRSAVRHAVMDRAAQVQSPAPASCLMPPDELRPHFARE